MEKKSKSPKAKNVKVVVSDEIPALTLKPGQRFEVVSVSLVDPTLQKAKPIAARLCGGTSTCLALVDLSDTLINPPS